MGGVLLVGCDVSGPGIGKRNAAVFGFQNDLIGRLIFPALAPALMAIHLCGFHPTQGKACHHLFSAKHADFFQCAGIRRALAGEGDVGAHKP